MPDIDLEPERYRPAGQARDMGPKWYRNWFFVSLAPLAYLFWYHDVITPDILFGATLVMAGASGMALHGWLRYIP